ncbi:methyltransferase domain-containing protein [Streptomyces zingiberis]|uniref:Methyltransferase domain-containing protein n=1 Tax=Streptomyces zingiberis TaxID=2053010 RepID=A0ABX1C9J0_9ACTN|nr:methyltransferase domain-containing protein [Streptomyces zingiberis]NJQ03604.1 methyltransferase domain-containing protein [Streptomyces zingiberis]
MTEPSQSQRSAPPTPSSEDVGRLYDENTEVVDSAAGGNIHSGYWENDADTSSLDKATDRLTDLVAERLDPAAGGRLLDIGCGTGSPAFRIATGWQARVTGITVSREELAVAQARAAGAGLTGTVSFHHADAMDLPVGQEPFGAGEFDGAWAIESLMHMSDRAAALTGAARALRPGGRLVVADVLLRRPVTGETKEFVDRMCQAFQAPWLPGPDEYREAVRAAGLELVEFTDIGENVRRTYRAFSEILGDAAAHGAPGPSGDEAGAGAGGSTEDSGNEFLGSTDDLPRFGDLPEIGYVLLVARRPDA